MKRFEWAVALVLLCSVLGGCAAVAVGSMGSAVVMANDRRTAGIYVEDENIEWKVIGLISSDFPGVHVNATSFNRRVLLTGEVSTDEVKSKLGARVAAVANVLSVANELQVGSVSSFTARGSDSYLTSSVKTRMLGSSRFSPNHVKVVTEASTVYLMGLVTREEGEAAADVARTSSGVKGVVKVFEYTN